MFNRTKVIDRTYGIVGLRQPLDPVFTLALDIANLASDSGYFVNDNPFVKLQWWLDTQDYKGINASEMNLRLKQIQQLAISDVCNMVFNKSAYIDRSPLYRFPQNNVATETLPAGFVGIKIKVADKRNIAFEIPRILLSFSGTGTFKLMLFNTSVPDPIEEQEITITGKNQSEDLNWVVDNSGDYYKGDYYLGYLTNGLSIEPFKRENNNAGVMSEIENLCFSSVKYTSHLTETMPDTDDEEGASETWGFNPDFFVRYDYTDLIDQNKTIFAKAIDYRMQIAFLSEYIASNRSNRGQRNANEITNIIIELNGQSEDTGIPKAGLNELLSAQISMIKSEVEKLNNSYFINGPVKLVQS